MPQCVEAAKEICHSVMRQRKNNYATVLRGSGKTIMPQCNEAVGKTIMQQCNDFADKLIMPQCNEAEEK